MSNPSLAADHRHDDKAAEKTALAVVIAISFCHMLNVTMQSLLLSIYPMLKENYALDFGQVGLITLTFQVTASLLQPMIGLYTDGKPKPYALAAHLTLLNEVLTERGTHEGEDRRREAGLHDRLLGGER